MERVNFKCTPILPTVFDESLSYYEGLCKLRNKLNEVIDRYNQSGSLPAPTEGQNGWAAMVVNGEWVASDAINQRLNEIDLALAVIRGDIGTLNTQLQSVYDGISSVTQTVNEINRTVV